MWSFYKFWTTGCIWCFHNCVKIFMSNYWCDRWPNETSIHSLNTLHLRCSIQIISVFLALWIVLVSVVWHQVCQVCTDQSGWNFCFTVCVCLCPYVHYTLHTCSSSRAKQKIHVKLYLHPASRQNNHNHTRIANVFPTVMIHKRVISLL